MQTGRRQFIGSMVAAAAVVNTSASPANDASAASRMKPTLRIAHLCDPQFGFVTRDPSVNRPEAKFKENYKADLARLERGIDVVNGLKPDLVLFGGDMTQWPADVTKEWPEILKRISPPVAVAPGNHDMGNRLTRENLERFRSVFGRDYGTLDVNGWRIIVGNSQYWRKTEAVDEQAKYEAWVKAELEKAKSFGGKVILASHIPPFAFTPKENDSYDNHPRKGRMERLEAYVASGARFYLAAHQHRLVTRGYKTLTILSGETTCCNFDARPFGFRMLEVADDFSYSWNFIAVPDANQSVRRKI